LNTHKKDFRQIQKKQNPQSYSLPLSPLHAWLFTVRRKKIYL